MAGSLIKIDEEIVTSAVASVTLGGADWDSSYDVYMVQYHNVQPASDNKNFFFRVTTSGTPDTTANYDEAYKILRANTTFSNQSATNLTQITVAPSLGNNTGEKANATMYLFNFNNASEYSFVTVEGNNLNLIPNNTGYQGGFVHTVTQACDGLHFYMESSININAGARFVLYGLKK